AAALESYELSAHWLREVLPLDQDVNATSVRRQVEEVAGKLDADLPEEEPTIEGCPRDWARLPNPDKPIMVGLDGGYVPARNGECKEGPAFEAIIGKSIPEGTKGKTLAFVDDDGKARERLSEVVEAQRAQATQSRTFLSAEGRNGRDLALFLYPNAGRMLDCFHITMRLTVL